MPDMMQGGVDASIPLQAGRGVQQNPLASSDPGQFANTLNSINQLKLFPLRQQGLELANQGQQLSNQKQQMDQHLTRLQYFSGLMQPMLLDKNGDATTGVDVKDIARGLATGVGDGFMQASDATSLLSTVPDGGQDPAKNRVWVLQHYAANQSAQGNVAQAQQMLSRPGATMDNGQQIQPGTIGGPLTQNRGFQPAGPATQTYPSRAQLITPTTYPNAAGTPVQTTGGGYAAEHGQGANTGPAGGGGGVVGTGGQPVGPQNPPRLAPPSGGSPQTLGPQPGTTEFQQNSATQLSAANARAGNFQSDMFPLTQAMTALQNAPTGKGSQAAHDVSSYLNTFAPPMLQKALSFISPIMTPAEVSAYDEAKKYLTQGTLGTAGATRSNEGLSTAGAASPNTEISKEAAQLVLRGMVGLRRMEQEGVLEFNNSGQAPGNYSKFQTQFATKADPRVYTFDLMDPDARAKIIQSLGKPGSPPSTKFWDQVHAATQNGILTPPSAAPNG